jgi:hypothetical protein
LHFAAISDPDALQEAKRQAQRDNTKFSASAVKRVINERKKARDEQNWSDHPRLKGREQTDGARENAKYELRKIATKINELADTARKLITSRIGHLSEADGDLFAVMTRSQNAWADAVNMAARPTPLKEAAE